MYGAIAVFITAFAFWVWTWGKGIPYINQEPGQKWRAKAKAAARNRSKVLDQSSIAWKSGEKGTAKTLSERGKQYGRQVERYNERAAKEIFLSLNPTYYHNPPTAETLGKIDLHGLFVTEALIFTQGHIQQCKQYGVTTTSIITGRGNNSKDGVAKIKPAVESLLVREGLTGKFRWENEGCVAVEIPLVAREPIVSRDNCVVM